MSKRFIYIIPIGIILILIAGLRPVGLDRDSLAYVNAINSFTSLFESNFNLEPSFWLIVAINKYLFGNYYVRMVFITYAILGVFFKLYGIKKLSLLPLLSIFIYISYYFILHEMTQIRVGVACGIFLLAIPDIFNRNLKAYLLKTILATLFHYSAIAMVSMYFINPTKLNKKFYLAIPLLGLVFAFVPYIGKTLLNILIPLFPSILSHKLSIYQQLTELGVGNFNKINLFNLYYTSITILYLFFVLNYSKFKSKYDLILIKILGWAIFVWYFFSFMPVLSFRVSEFLGIVIIILLADSVPIFKDKIIASEIVIIYVALNSINMVFIHRLLNL